MKTIKNNCSAGIRIMSAAWKKQVMSDEIECGSDPPIILFVRHYHYSFTVPVPLSLYPISPCPRESTRLRKTGTIWKQWNHMRVDSHWTFTHNARVYCLIANVHGTSMVWFRANIMHAGNQQQKEWLKGTYHKRHYWLWNTVYDANTGKIR